MSIISHQYLSFDCSSGEIIGIYDYRMSITNKECPDSFYSISPYLQDIDRKDENGTKSMRDDGAAVTREIVGHGNWRFRIF